MSAGFDAYKILGVPSDANKNLIKANYRKLAIRCHPDKFTDPDVKKDKEAEFKVLGLAYETLINERRRVDYDCRNRTKDSTGENDDNDHSKPSEGDTPSQFGMKTTGEKTLKGLKRTEGAIESRNPRAWQDQGRYLNTTSEEMDQTDSTPHQAREMPTSKHRRQTGMLVTQGLIQEQQVKAMPDTGAGYNLITASLAQSIGFAFNVDSSWRAFSKLFPCVECSCPDRVASVPATDRYPSYLSIEVDRGQITSTSPLAPLSLLPFC